MNALMQPDVNQETAGLIIVHVLADPVSIVRPVRHKDPWIQFGNDKIEMARRFSSRVLSQLNDHWPDTLPAIIAFPYSPYLDVSGRYHDWLRLITGDDMCSYSIVSCRTSCLLVFSALKDVCEKVLKELAREYQVNEGLW